MGKEGRTRSKDEIQKSLKQVVVTPRDYIFRNENSNSHLNVCNTNPFWGRQHASLGPERFVCHHAKILLQTQAHIQGGQTATNKNPFCSRPRGLVALAKREQNFKDERGSR